MAFLDSLKDTLSGRPTQLAKPFFMKAESDSIRQLEQLKSLLPYASPEVKPQIEQDIKMLTYGIAGEDNVAFELNNSFLPIIVLHDLYIEYDGLTAQIDYLVETAKFTLIIECKNLYGNIEISNRGDFVRTMEFNGRFKKEGIYSPITQNTRHLELLKRVRLSTKTNLITRALFEKGFDDYYKTVVVLANPKTVVNMKYATKNIKDQIIRADQLIEYIKRLLKESPNQPSSERDMFEHADVFLKHHTLNQTDYTKKYGINIPEPPQPKPIPEPAMPPVVLETPLVDKKVTSSGIEDTPIYKALKEYRYKTCTAEGIKAYYIFNNAQLEDLIGKMPKTLEELKSVSGFGDGKCLKYGSAILEIVNKHRAT
jgi:hypothetical protein